MSVDLPILLNTPYHSANMKPPRKFALISDEYGPFTAIEKPVHYEGSKGDILTVFDLMALLSECPGDARITVSAGDEAEINVNWEGGYFSIPAPQSKTETATQH